MVKKGVIIGGIILVVIAIAVVIVVLVLLANDGWTMVENAYADYFVHNHARDNPLSLESAKVACMASAECNAITLDADGNYTLRKGTVIKDSTSGETSWFRI